MTERGVGDGDGGGGGRKEDEIALLSGLLCCLSVCHTLSALSRSGILPWLRSVGECLCVGPNLLYASSRLSECLCIASLSPLASHSLISSSNHRKGARGWAVADEQCCGALRTGRRQPALPDPSCDVDSTCPALPCSDQDRPPMDRAPSPVRNSGGAAQVPSAV